MRRLLIYTIAATMATALTTGLTVTSAPAAPGANKRPHGIKLSTLGTYHTGIFDASAAEIVTHDPATQRLFVANAAAAEVDVDRAAGGLRHLGRARHSSGRRSRCGWVDRHRHRESPMAALLLVVANEVSGTSTLFRIDRTGPYDVIA